MKKIYTLYNCQTHIQLLKKYLGVEFVAKLSLSNQIDNKKMNLTMSAMCLKFGSIVISILNVFLRYYRDQQNSLFLVKQDTIFKFFFSLRVCF